MVQSDTTVKASQKTVFFDPTYSFPVHKNTVRWVFARQLTSPDQFHRIFARFHPLTQGFNHTVLNQGLNLRFLYYS
jgi:hypothetical protein